MTTALYLHGFGSGPDSYKGVWLDRHFSALGLPLQRLNLRAPSFERLRFPAIVEVVTEAMADPSATYLLIGSSLGGLTAAHVAAKDPRVAAVVLLAPAFGLAERWRRQDPEAVERWRRTGWLDTQDHANKVMTKVHQDFLRDMEEVEVPDVRVPTLIVHGVQDTVVPVDGSRAFVATYPNATLVEVADDHELVSSLPRIAAEMTPFLRPWLPTG